MINNELENLGCTKTRPDGEYVTLCNYKHKKKKIYTYMISQVYILGLKNVNL